MSVQALTPDVLYRQCDPGLLSFRTTAEVEDLDGVIGQDRAVAAVRFGIGIRRRGYNLFALGPSGTGKYTTIRRFLEARAKDEPTPPDWVYVNNFATPSRPIAIELPSGLGRRLRADMDRLIDDLRAAIPAAFESDDYRTRKQAIDEEFKERQENAFESLQKRAREKDVTLVRTPVGLALAPTRNGEVLEPKAFEELPSEERERIEADIAALQEELQATVQKVPRWDKERRDRLRELSRTVTMYAVGHLIDTLRSNYKDHKAVTDYLTEVQGDVIANVEAFLGQRGEGQQQQLVNMLELGPRTDGGDPFRRYRVNLLVDNSDREGAPVIYEDNPTQPNLIGRVEHLAELGALVTDFNLIKSGALARANGGYLILDARKLLMQPFAWEALKRALLGGELRFESLGQMVGLVSTVSLEPQPLPLDLKVVLMGERMIYYLLCQYDPEFGELFKVAVDFEDELDRDPESTRLYARLVATLVRQEGLRHFDAGAVARVIEQSARLADDAERLTARVGLVVDLLREADFWAGEAGREMVTRDDVERAIDAQIARVDRLRERSLEMIERGTLLIDTSGEAVGQINGLSVLTLGSYAFGRPSRITARVRMGAGEVVDIERKVELGGPIHSKGVLILAAFLGARYSFDRPLSLAASLVFEQSYSGVDGDSASSAELYALLSALADAPIKQSLAVTGSVNQHGRIQAIGGVNEKIEGFFDVCKVRGLTGDQGVLIPESNVKHLMLRRDVVEAVAAGRFHVYPVATVDEGIEILTGVPAGARDADGAFPEGSINRRVEARLAALAEARRAFAAAAKDRGNKDEEGDEGS